MKEKIGSLQFDCILEIMATSQCTLLPRSTTLVYVSTSLILPSIKQSSLGVFNACQIKKKEVAAEQTGLQRHSAEFY
jgi:hypothetical protein